MRLAFHRGVQHSCVTLVYNCGWIHRVILTVIQHDDVEYVQKLTFVFVNTFKLAVKHGDGIHIDVVSLLNIADQFILVVLWRRSSFRLVYRF